MLSDIALDEKKPSEATVLRLATVSRYDLDKYYEQIDTDRLNYLYMCAIDRYRVTQLEPPFIELVECLQRVDDDRARNYLENPELIIILGLYKQALGMPSETMVNLADLDLTAFYPSFHETLRNLFSKYFDVDSILGATSADPSTTQQQSQGGLSRSGRREQTRLTSQRRRLLKISKKYEENRHKRMREHRNALLQSAKSPEVLEAEKIVLIQRQNRSEGQVARRRQLRQQKRPSSPRAKSEYVGATHDDRRQIPVEQHEDRNAQAQQGIPLPMQSGQASQQLSFNDSTALPSSAALGAHVPRPGSSSHSLDAYITYENDQSRDPLADDPSELYDIVPCDAESQHRGRDDSNLLHGVTSGTPRQRDILESPLICFEPNSQDERQFCQELCDYAARWNKSGSIVEFLLDELPASEASEHVIDDAHNDRLQVLDEQQGQRQHYDMQVQQEIPLQVPFGQSLRPRDSMTSHPMAGADVPRPISPHYDFDQNNTPDNDSVQILLTDAPLEQYSLLDDTGSQQLGQGYDNQVYKVTIGKPSHGNSLGSSSISEPESIVDEFLLNEPTSEVSGDYPGS